MKWLRSPTASLPSTRSAPRPAPTGGDNTLSGPASSSSHSPPAEATSIASTTAALRALAISRVLGVAGAQVSYPLISRNQGVDIIVEPIAMIAYGTPDANDDGIPNEDSLVFEADETNLFKPNAVSNYDLWEGGARASVGISATALIGKDVELSTLVGKRWREDADPAFNSLSNLAGEESDYVASVRADFGKILDVGPFSGSTRISRSSGWMSTPTPISGGSTARRATSGSLPTRQASRTRASPGTANSRSMTTGPPSSTRPATSPRDRTSACRWASDTRTTACSSAIAYGAPAARPLAGPVRFDQVYLRPHRPGRRTELTCIFALAGRIAPYAPDVSHLACGSRYIRHVFAFHRSQGPGLQGVAARAVFLRSRWPQWLFPPGLPPWPSNRPSRLPPARSMAWWRP